MQEAGIQIEAFLLGIAICVAFGLILSKLAEKWNFPRTVVLIFTGVIVGIVNSLPELFGLVYNIYIPDDMKTFIPLGEFSEIILLVAELTLSIVLFREGIELKIRDIRRNILPIALLASIGLVITTLLAGFIIAITVAPITLTVALLLGGTLSPTDPAATFSFFRGGTIQIRQEFRTILNGESAFNDAIAIILVIYVLLPLSSGKLGPDAIPMVILDSIVAIVGGIIIGGGVGLLTIRIISQLTTSAAEINSITFAAGIFVFALSTFLQNYGISTSFAIAALLAGFMVGSPERFGGKKFRKLSTIRFWEEISFLAETVAFVFIGLIFEIDDLLNPEIMIPVIVIGTIITIITLLARVAAVNVTLGRLFDRGEKTFIGMGGMRGLATAVLALIIYKSPPEGIGISIQLALYIALFALLLSTLIQGSLIKRVANIAGTSEQIDEKALLEAQQDAGIARLEYLMSLREENQISEEDFLNLTISLRDEIATIDSKLQVLIKRDTHAIQMLTFTRESLTRSLDHLETHRGEYALEIFKKVRNDLCEEITEINEALEIAMGIQTPPETTKEEKTLIEQIKEIISNFRSREEKPTSCFDEEEKEEDS
ncbi:MAG: cation:proton antiporter [Candidatus Hermodarchaeota archaeon]